MPRVTMKPEERRRTIAFSISGLTEQKLDEHIEKTKKKMPYAEYSRQTIMENLLLEFLDKQEKSRQ